MIGQERNRYRYMPHIFHGYSGYREDTVSSYAIDPGAGGQTNVTHLAAKGGA